MKLRIALVDDHVLLRGALHLVLAREPDFEVVGEADEAASALALFEAQHPDVALVDIAMPGGDGLGLVRAARHKAPDTRILVLTMFATEGNARDALAAGAAGFATKTQTLPEITAAIRQIGAGKRYLPPGFDVERPPPLGTTPLGAAALSEREKEVLSLLVEGKATKEIAVALSISVKTVETHRSSINRKLGVHSVGELMRFAAAHGRLFS